MKGFTSFFILIYCHSPMLYLEDEKTDQALYEKAKELSNKFLIVDTHIDVPYRIKSKWEDISSLSKVILIILEQLKVD